MKRKELELRYKMLKERCATLVEEYHMKMFNDATYIENRFMMDLGRYEIKALQLSMEIRRWKKRFALRQEALNAGREPDLILIESMLEKETDLYMEELKSGVEKISRAESYFNNGILSAEETNEIRLMYLKAAKLLHPDVNPHLSEREAGLWNKISEAYKNRAWKDVAFLAELINQTSLSDREFPQGAEGDKALADECCRLDAFCREQEKKTMELREKIPWKYEELLKDRDEVDARKERLLEEICAAEKIIKTYEKKWKMEVRA